MNQFLPQIYPSGTMSRIFTDFFPKRNQFQLRLERYARDLRDYEERYGMDTRTFHERFEAGKLGDSADFFEWDGIYNLHLDLMEKIRRLESTL